MTDILKWLDPGILQQGLQFAFLGAVIKYKVLPIAHHRRFELL